MATDVIMPKVDMDQENGTVTRWLKKEGDAVRQGETILEIETDKVAIEVEAPASGILAQIQVEEGETVPIATVIATIHAPDEVTGQSVSASVRETSLETEAELVRTPQDKVSGNGVPITPVARKYAQTAGVDLSTVTGSGPGGKVTRKDVERALQPTAPSVENFGKPYATPAARRLADELNVSLELIDGSGPGNRIQVADVKSAAKLRSSGRTAKEQPITTQATYEIVPLHGKRRTAAERLTESYQSIPHIHFTARIDMTRFTQARASMNARVRELEAPRITATALLTKIVADSLTRHRWLNSSYQQVGGEKEAEIHLFNEVNIGVAVALDDGLIVPVVHNVPDKGVAQIATEIDDLVTRARNGTLMPADVRGGTFTLSNLGPYGVEQFMPIINPPQAAILAVGATTPEVVADEGGQIVVRPMVRITLAVDHRVVDGAVAANFIADLKASVESPVLLLL